MPSSRRIVPKITFCKSRKRWVVDCGVAFGRRQRRFFRSRKDARGFADQKTAEARAAVEWFLSLSLDEVVEVHRMYREHRQGQSGPADAPKVTVAEAVEGCLERKRRAELSGRYLEELGKRLRGFSRKVGEGRLLAGVTADEVAGYVYDGPKVSQATRHGRLRDVRVLFAHALKSGWLAKDPCEGVQAPKVPPPPRRVLAPQEAKKLLQEMPERHRPLLAVLLFAGLRPEAEGARLRWEDFDWEDGRILLTSGKTAMRRSVEIRPTLAAWLEHLGCRGRTGRVMAPGWEAARKEACRRSGVVWTPDVTRHSCASYWLEAEGEGDAGRVARWLGHSEKVMQAHYKALVRRPAAVEWWGLTPKACQESFAEISSSCGS